ncbi:MAG: type IV pilus biogenesis/stability protein PilW [Betaproteobacteria bacterium]|nr:type IV pilus biogenesis/stability protein PilW [Betaproteobacteria bacterium]
MRLAPSLLSIAVALAVAGCVSQTTVESKLPDQSAPSEPGFRAKLHTERAAEYFKIGSYATAIEAAQTALQHVSGYAPAYNMLGIIHMQLRQDDTAQQAFDQAIRLAPNDSEVLNNYGWFICERRNPKDAMRYFETALRNPLYVSPERALHNAGYCARKAGNIPAAEANFRAALVKSPLHAPSLLELADLLYGMGRMKDAEPLMARYLQVMPSPPAEGLSLAVKLARVTGDKSSEASYIQQMRRRFPDDPRTREAIESR